jgi:PTS system nitrogen regulatory IIA component
MNLFNVLKPDTVRCHAAASDSDALLRAIADLAAGSGALPGAPPEAIFDALRARERLGSTGFGHGVAIPHCRIPDATDFVAGFVTVSEGIDFDSLDGEKAFLFPFVIGPENRPREHLSLLSDISQTLRDSKLRDRLRECDSPSDLVAILKEEAAHSDPEEPVRRPGMKMLHVFIANEKLFDEILQVFTTGTLSAVVIETHESTEYISRIPFFAGFWSTDINQFNRVIVAVIRDELVNSTVRRIEYVSGRLADRTDVMVTLTDLHYVLGSLTEPD